MRVKIAIPEPHVSKPVLDAGLEAVTRLNEQMLLQGEIPTFERGLRYGIQWRPEPKGDEHFDHAQRVIARKAGDCDDLAPWHAASLRVTGEDPEAFAEVVRSGPKMWHAIVRRGNGDIDDPSRRAGMRAGVEPMAHGVMGAVFPLMLQPGSSVSGAFMLRPQISLRPVYGQIQARADLPWHWKEHAMADTPSQHDIAMSALHTAPVAETALTGAINGVVRLAAAAGCGQPDHISRLQAIADACQGVDFRTLCHRYGEANAHKAAAVVGSFFGKLGRGLGHLARSAVKFIPGVGPVVDTAIDMGSGLLHHGHHDSPAAAAPPHAMLVPADMVHPRVAPSPGLIPLHPGVAAVEPSSGRDVHIHVY